MRESDFNTEIVNSIKALGGWAYKIPDIVPGGGSRFTPDKPCDILGGYKGKFIGIESKQMKKFEALGIRHVRYNQEKSLDEMVAKGNRAFLFINVRIRAVKGKVKRENRLIPLDWKEWGPVLKLGSLKASEIEKLYYITGTDGKFHLREVLDSL